MMFLLFILPPHIYPLLTSAGNSSIETFFCLFLHTLAAMMRVVFPVTTKSNMFLIVKDVNDEGLVEPNLFLLFSTVGFHNL